MMTKSSPNNCEVNLRIADNLDKQKMALYNMTLILYLVAYQQTVIQTMNLSSDVNLFWKFSEGN